MPDSVHEPFAAWSMQIRDAADINRLEAIQNPPDDRRAAGALIDLLVDADEVVRTCAAESLANFDSEDVRHALRHFLASERSDLAREYALESLGLVGTYCDVDHLLEQAQAPTGDLASIGAHLGLFYAARRVAVRALVRTIAEADAISCMNAARALQLVFEWDDDLFERATEALQHRSAAVKKGEAGLKETLREVLSFLDSDDA